VAIGERRIKRSDGSIALRYKTLRRNEGRGSTAQLILRSNVRQQRPADFRQALSELTHKLRWFRGTIRYCSSWLLYSKVKRMRSALAAPNSVIFAWPTRVVAKPL
jgi:hypothetical protein